MKKASKDKPVVLFTGNSANIDTIKYIQGKGASLTFCLQHAVHLENLDYAKDLLSNGADATRGFESSILL